MRYFICCLFLFSSVTNFIYGQVKLSNEDKEYLLQLEDSMLLMADSMFRAPIPDERLDYGFRFAALLKESLEIEGSYQFPFERLGKKIHILQPKDGSFKIFNWLVIPSEIIRRYYGVIQMQDETIFPLMNNPGEINEELEFATLDRRHWFGNEYYRIQEVLEGDQKYYCLFGLNTDGNYSNKKSLDVLYFKNKEPFFGAPIFNMPDASGRQRVLKNRVIWEYSKSGRFSLNFDESKSMIMFDRLQSEINDPKRKNSFVPAGQTDGLKWEKGQWNFVKEAIPILKLKEGQAPIDGVFPGR